MRGCPAVILPGLGLSVGVLGLDQLTKALILDYFLGRVPYQPIWPFFNLVLVWNEGISFSLLEGGGNAMRYILSAFALIVSLGLAIWLIRQQRLLPALAMGLVIGGAIGNMIDRLRFGAVVDFLDFYLGNLHWPAFNVADSAIVVGAALLVVDAVIFAPKAEAEPKKSR